VRNRNGFVVKRFGIECVIKSKITKSRNTNEKRNTFFSVSLDLIQKAVVSPMLDLHLELWFVT